MPRSRKRDESDNEPSNEATQAAPKRQRVSLACDACRAAREKCDGDKPQCGPCTSQKRQCSYTPASKKRGVATGYLRTLESSLAWLFDYSPESEKALQAFLSEKRALDPRLQKKWTKSRVHKEVTRMLSDAPPTQKDGSAADDSDQEIIDPGSSQYMDATPSDRVYSPQDRHSRARRGPETTIYQLPPNWRDLISIHFSHTHQWLPIVDREDLMRTIEAYPAHGLILSSDDAQCADHAQLWAVFALASFQAPTSDTGHDPKTLFSIARGLMPSEIRTYRQSHVSALLLHGLVLLGQDSPLAACLVIGSACRITLQLHASKKLDLTPSSTALREGLRPLGARIIAGCCVLETWASLTLGQPAVLSTELNQILQGLSMEDENEAAAQGSFLSRNSDSEAQAALLQLNRFGNLLEEGLRKRAIPGARRITTEDLVKSLYSQFSFCNCLIHEDTTPRKPSAYLLQLAFLTATVALAAQCRPSLLSTVFEVAETCLSSIGEMGTPPLAVALLKVVLAKADNVSGHEKRRWKDIIDRAQKPWLQPPEILRETSTLTVPPAAREMGIHRARENLPAAGFGNAPDFGQTASEQLHLEYASSSYQEQIPHDGLVSMGEGSAGIGTAGIISPEHGHSARPTAQLTHRMPLQSPSLAKGPALLYGNPVAQGIDYDAIMEELGSIDCNDVVESDQFLTNLGFAPDYDLGDMFQQGYFMG
ncbi:hypothetical protein NLU13_4407 [Sarocladium strictum]|uniref:Zn(2)-C6 fungal-type domain-containing protein n=1 Tax=Sarocladium strictum TaxID=5046 RepID=A0AA39GIT6_SARSR|nr:hypothetical protein NLU13_4407 [Sarocladium strictum]